MPFFFLLPQDRRDLSWLKTKEERGDQVKYDRQSGNKGRKQIHRRGKGRALDERTMEDKKTIWAEQFKILWGFRKNEHI